MLDLPKATLGWIAGILDGEGWFTINKDSRGDWYSIRVGVGNTDEKMIDVLYSLVGGGKHKLKQKQDKRFPKTKLKQQYSWYLDGCGQVSSLLSVVYPYLVTKKERARLIIEYCTHKMLYGTNDEYYYLKLKELNK